MEPPFIALTKQVPVEWIDVNGHMNATHYGLVAYDAHYRYTETLGLGGDYVASTECGKVVLESHIVYERELCLNDQIEIYAWLLAVDHKRLHFFYEIYNKTKQERAATSEQVDIHVDLKKRVSAPLPKSIYHDLQKRVTQNLIKGIPQGVGSHIKPPKNLWI